MPNHPVVLDEPIAPAFGVKVQNDGRALRVLKAVAGAYGLSDADAVKKAMSLRGQSFPHINTFRKGKTEQEARGYYKKAKKVDKIESLAKQSKSNGKTFEETLHDLFHSHPGVKAFAKQRGKEGGGGGGGKGKGKGKGGGDEDKKKKKKEKRKNKKRARMSRIMQVYTSVGEGTVPRKMTAWGNILANLVLNPYDAGSSKSDVFKPSDFNHALTETVCSKRLEHVIRFVNKIEESVDNFVLNSNNGHYRNALYNIIMEDKDLAPVTTRALQDAVDRAHARILKGITDISTRKEVSGLAYMNMDGSMPVPPGLDPLVYADRRQAMEYVMKAKSKLQIQVNARTSKLGSSILDTRRMYATMFTERVNVAVETHNNNLKEGSTKLSVTAADVDAALVAAEKELYFTRAAVLLNTAYRHIELVLLIARHPDIRAMLAQFRNNAYAMWSTDEAKVTEGVTHINAMLSMLKGIGDVFKKHPETQATIFLRLGKAMRSLYPGGDNFSVKWAISNVSLRKNTKPNMEIQKTCWNVINKAMTHPKIFEMKTETPIPEIKGNTFPHIEGVSKLAKGVILDIIQPIVSRRCMWKYINNDEEYRDTEGEQLSQQVRTVSRCASALETPDALIKYLKHDTTKAAFQTDTVPESAGLAYLGTVLGIFPVPYTVGTQTNAVGAYLVARMVQLQQYLGYDAPETPDQLPLIIARGPDIKKALPFATPNTTQSGLDKASEIELQKSNTRDFRKSVQASLPKKGKSRSKAEHQAAENLMNYDSYEESDGESSMGDGDEHGGGAKLQQLAAAHAETQRVQRELEHERARTIALGSELRASQLRESEASAAMAYLTAAKGGSASDAAMSADNTATYANTSPGDAGGEGAGNGNDAGIGFQTGTRTADAFGEDGMGPSGPKSRRPPSARALLPTLEADTA